MSHGVEGFLLCVIVAVAMAVDDKLQASYNTSKMVDKWSEQRHNEKLQLHQIILVSAHSFHPSLLGHPSGRWLIHDVGRRSLVSNAGVIFLTIGNINLATCQHHSLTRTQCCKDVTESHNRPTLDPCQQRHRTLSRPGIFAVDRPTCFHLD